MRLGADHVAKINDRFHIFAGPGIQIWSGKPKFEQGSSSAEGVKTMRIALEGRVGIHMAWTDKVGGFCQLGHYIGYAASAQDEGAKATWWPSGHDGAFGIALKF